MHTLTLAFFAGIQRTARVRAIWPSDDEIAARVRAAGSAAAGRRPVTSDLRPAAAGGATEDRSHRDLKHLA